MGFMMLGQQPDDEFYWTVLDGSVVAIVLVEDADYAAKLCFKVSHTQEHRLPHFPCDETGIMHPPDPRRTRCLGQGLCMSVQAESYTLVLQTPARLDVLAAIQEANETGVPRIILVKGNLDPPAWAYLESLVPYENRDAEVDEEQLARDEREDAYIAEQLGPDFRRNRNGIDFDQDSVPWLSQLSVGRGTAKPRELW